MQSTNGHGPRKAILYARVSTEEQARSGYSLAQQMEALREYAGREGYEVLEEILDPGQSGASLERREHRNGVLQLEGRAYKRKKDSELTQRGPYWYFHYREGGKQRTLYVGKTDNPEVAVDEKLGKE